ncbi:MAG: ROK family protein [Culicoidibacterales bacterium]
MGHICFDIGGSSIKMVVITENNEFLFKKSVSVQDEIQKIYQIMSTYISEVKVTFPNLEIQGMAISAPGAVNPQSGIIGGASALTSIHGPNFKMELKKLTGLDVAIENDANCAALAELYYGAAKGCDDICTMVIGTGVGGTIVKSRQVHHGHHLHGGEFGYLLVQTDEMQVETLSNLGSTRALVTAAQTIDRTIQDGEAVFRAAESDARIQKVIEQFYFYLALGAINIQYTYDPEVIIFGGAISQQPQFIENIQAKIQTIVTQSGMSHTIVPICKTCTYYNDANLLGAKVNFIQRQQA